MQHLRSLLSRSLASQIIKLVPIVLIAAVCLGGCKKRSDAERKAEARAKVDKGYEKLAAAYVATSDADGWQTQKCDDDAIRKLTHRSRQAPTIPTVDHAFLGAITGKAPSDEAVTGKAWSWLRTGGFDKLRPLEGPGAAEDVKRLAFDLDVVLRKRFVAVFRNLRPEASGSRPGSSFSGWMVVFDLTDGKRLCQVRLERDVALLNHPVELNENKSNTNQTFYRQLEAFQRAAQSSLATITRELKVR